MDAHLFLARALLQGVCITQPLGANLFKEMSDFFTAVQYRSEEMGYGTSAEQRVVLTKRGKHWCPK